MKNNSLDTIELAYAPSEFVITYLHRDLMALTPMERSAACSVIKEFVGNAVRRGYVVEVYDDMRNRQVVINFSKRKCSNDVQAKEDREAEAESEESDSAWTLPNAGHIR